jgi:hypothetical protein
MAIDSVSPYARDHWEEVWQTKSADQVSWFQQSPEP